MVFCPKFSFLCMFAFFVVVKIPGNEGESIFFLCFYNVFLGLNYFVYFSSYLRNYSIFFNISFTQIYTLFGINFVHLTFCLCKVEDI